jgi:hypothetical protein
VQVAGEPQPFLGDGQAGVRGAGAVEFLRDAQRPRRGAAGERGDAADDEGIDQECPDERVPASAGAAHARRHAAGHGRARQYHSEQRGQAQQRRERHRQRAAEDHGHEDAYREHSRRRPGEGREGRSARQYARRGQRDG